MLLYPADSKCSLSIIHLDEDHQLDSGSYVAYLFSCDSGQLCVFPSMINWPSSREYITAELPLLALWTGVGEIIGSHFLILIEKASFLVYKFKNQNHSIDIQNPPQQ